jgi:predicted transcriptional regulator
MAKIREIMETDAYICRISSTIGEVLRHLAEKRVSGVPILDESGQLAGFISDGDIMKYIAKTKPQIICWDSHMPLLYDNTSLEKKLSDLMQKNVMDLATRKVIWVDAEQDIDEAAHILGKKQIKKAPVLADGKLAGVISRSAIIRYAVQLMMPPE